MTQAPDLQQMVEILRAIIGNANEAPRHGPFDQIDNHGDAYQSQAFANALEAGRKALAEINLRTLKEQSNASE